MEDRPKLFKEKSAVTARLLELEEPHIVSLTKFVKDLRGTKGNGFSIPHFDPWDGGINAELLYLLEAPGPKARDSGFVSLNNFDETAKNFFELNAKAGVARKRIAIWNIVPWYVGSDSRIRPVNSADIADGIESLSLLLQLFPHLRAIALIGSKAKKATVHIEKIIPTVKIFTAPHPSPMFINRKKENETFLLNRLKEIQAFLDSSDLLTQH